MIGFLSDVPLIVILVFVLAALILKRNAHRQNPAIKDPLLQSRVPRMAFLLAMSFLMIAIVLNFLNLPYAKLLYYLDILLQLGALVLSFIYAKQEERVKREDILDD